MVAGGRSGIVRIICPACGNQTDRYAAVKNEIPLDQKLLVKVRHFEQVGEGKGDALLLEAVSFLL